MTTDRPADPTNPKDLIGSFKPPLYMVPGTALAFISKVMESGAAKYGEANWRDSYVRHSIYLSAALRHIYQAIDGEEADAETGLPHEAHAAACMCIILDAMMGGQLIKDLPTSGPMSETLSQLGEEP